MTYLKIDHRIGRKSFYVIGKKYAFLMVLQFKIQITFTEELGSRRCRLPVFYEDEDYISVHTLAPTEPAPSCTDSIKTPLHQMK